MKKTKQDLILRLTQFTCINASIHVRQCNKDFRVENMLRIISKEGITQIMLSKILKL